ncbi:molybdenum cofactor sulfurase 2 isoform X2 [Macrosteles quadrilineatus]|nr:molybdenum cofactor sulfurase 2 isoform X2 [Macrosteles quadrilineatus]XP_054266777.1 molybdenum cofactor sulfurase 2 isoform X2 [Macrosteles quadrilineatus]
MRNVDNIRQNSVTVRCIPQAEAVMMLAADVGTRKPKSRGNSLFVYPAQCNFSGVKYPLSWVHKVQQGALDNGRSHRWFCLLDAATLVSTNTLDLSAVRPDFVCLSFYKMFGLPTGLGALLVRNTSTPVLHKRYYGGGTVQVAMSSKPVHVLRPSLHERFEDGTINYLSIIAVRHGLDWWQKVGLTETLLSNHCFRLARYTHMRLRQLHHANNRAAVCLYADTAYDDPSTQGGIVNFNMVRDNGQFVGCIEVLNLANLHGIHLRTGCFCNPGACQRHLGMTDEQYYANFEAGHVCGDDKDLINGRPTGSVRVSFGSHSRQSDVDRLLKLLIDCFVTKPAVIRDPDEWEELTRKLRHKFTNVNLNLTKQQVEKNGIDINREPVCNRKIESTSHQRLAETNGSEPTPTSLRVTRVCLYPVKSCGALEVDSWPLDHRGLRYDRGWMVISDLGTALTQKHEPRMCLIRPLIDEEQGLMTLTFKGYPRCSVPMHPSSADATTAGLCQSKVCGSQVQGWDCGEPAAQWLTTVLGRPGLRLLRQSDHYDRASKGKKNSSTSLALSNQAQFLLVNENSVNWLSDKLPDQSDCSEATMVDRFRSNFVVQGDLAPFEEQKWTEVVIGSIPFKVDGPCGRCQMICIDQTSGQKTKEPLTTLAANCNGSMKFGIYLSQKSTDDSAVVKVGDSVIPSIH